MSGAIVSPPVIAAALIGIIAFAAVKLLWGFALWTKRTEHRIGDRFGDEAGEVIEWSGRAGFVSAGGERWRAVSKDTLAAGDPVRIAKVKGLTLDVRKS
ncbi:MAG: NfeD family protein [Parvularculaceae bacterium]